MPANPFPQGIAWSFQPSGAFLSFDAGLLQARIFQGTGHMALAGPDLAGTPAARVILFAPPAVQTSAGVVRMGRVVASTPLANGLELTQELGTAHITARLTFAHDGVMRYEVIDFRGVTPIATAVASAAASDERFYGFGEKFNAFNQAGKTVHVVTFDNPGNKGDHSYKGLPWFVSTRGYGFHLDSSAESTFEMRLAGTDRCVVTNHFKTLAFNVVYGPKLTEVLVRYTGYVGRPPLPPPFAFGPWISSDIWRDGGEVRYAVTKFRERGIPVSAFVYDSPWEKAYNDFAFNIGAGPTADQNTQFGRDGTFENQPTPSRGFKSLNEMMTFLQHNGLKAICWLTPFLNTTSAPEAPVKGQNLGEPVFQGGIPAGVFVHGADGKPLSINWWKGTGRPLDFTNPTARDFLTAQLKRLLGQSEVVTKAGAKETAIGGFKPDDGEARTVPGANHNATGEYIPPAAVYADGRKGDEMINGYCIEYLKTVYNVLGAKGVIFSRSGSTGTQAFPGCWAGDNQPNFGAEDGLPSVIVAGLTAAMSGFCIWGHDIGGYLNGPFSAVSPANLFMRWTQFGCFTPLMQMHRTLDATHPLRQYPWGYPEAGESLDDNAALTNYRFYTRLHTQLFPYIYTYAKESSTTGLPIIRPLVLLHPDDPETFEINDQYCFGNELLVAPMITPNNTNSRDVYLPEGNWFDFWTNARHTGKQHLALTNANQAQIPLFVREGAIVPMLLTEPQTLCDANYVNNAAIQSMDDGLQFLIYPGGTTQFTVHDGTSAKCVKNPASTEITLDSIARPIVLKIFGNEPAAVTLDGAPLAKLSASVFATATSGWQFDAGFVFVKFQHSGGSARIRF